MDPTSARPAALRFILFAVLLDALGIGLIIPVLPAVVDALNTGTGRETATVYGLLVGTYALAQFLCAPLIGALSDRFGRRPVLLVSIATLGINFAATYWAPTLAWLFATRLLSGATAANVTAANAYVADVSDAGVDRARNFGRVGAMFGIGFVVGPALGGVLGETDPRLPFLVAAGLCALNVLYGVVVLPESLPPGRRRPVDVSRLNPVGALAALGRYPAVGRLAVVVGLTAVAQYALHASWVLYTGERYGWGPRANGLSLMAVGVFMAGVQGGLIGRLSTAFGDRRLLMLGLACAAAAQAGMGLAPTAAWFFAALPLAALGGVAGPSAQSLVTQRVPAGEQGAVQGALASLSSLAAVVSPLGATTLLAHFTQRGPVPYVPGAPLLAGALTLVAAAGVAAGVRRS